MKSGCKKIAAVLCFLAAAALGAAETEVWYVHGWNALRASKGSPDKELVLLKEVFPIAVIRCEEWDSLGTFDEAVEKADRFTDTIVDRIAALPEERRGNLVLVGHSLGGRIVVRTVAKLADRKVAIREAVLLATAIPANDRDCVRAFSQQLIRCTNIYCLGDTTLRSVYGVMGEAQYVNALGVVGYDIPPFHRQYRSDGHNHGIAGYIDCLKKRLGNPSDPPVKLNLQILHGCKPIKTFGSFKSPIEQYCGWKLYCNYGNYMILDPADQVRAYGTEKQMRESFDDIKRQLKNQKD